MSTLHRSWTPLVLVLGGTAYLGLLCVLLVWWHLAPEIVLALTAAGSAFLVLSLHPYLGVHLLITTLFVENLWGGGAGITPMKVIGAVILGGWLVHMAVQRRGGVPIDALTLCLFLFLVWCGVSTVSALDAEVATSRTFQFVQLGLALLMISSVVDTPRRVRSVYWNIVVSTVLSTTLAVVMYYMRLTTTATGLLGNRNLLAIYINIAIVCAYLLLQTSEQGLRRIFLFVSLPILFLGMALTLSRTGLIVMGVTVCFVWYRVVKQRRFLLLVGSMTMLLALTYVLPTEFWTRTSSIVPAISRQEDTFGSRVRLWVVATRMIRDRPIVGVGPANYTVAFPRYARGGEQFLQNFVTHNAYLGVAAENGLVGGGLFVGLAVLALIAARRGIWIGRIRNRRDLEILSVAAEGSLMAVLLSGLTGNIEGQKCLWISMGLAAAIERISTRVLREDTARDRVEPAPSIPMQERATWVLARPGR